MNAMTANTTSDAKDLAGHEAWVKARPDKYYSTFFLGRAAYDKRPADTLAEARANAKHTLAERANDFNKGRPCMIYAVRGVHQVHVENVQ